MLTTPSSLRWRQLSSALYVTLLAACSVGPQFRSPGDDLANVDLYSAAGGKADGISPAEVSPDWWVLFKDPTLNELESRLDAGNLNLLAATARVDESRATLGITDAALAPQIGLGASYARNAQSAKTPLHLIGAKTTPYEQWLVGFQASWELDLWGHLRHQSDAAHARFAASELAVETTRVAITAELAGTYLRLRGVQAQAGIAGQQLETARHLSAMAESRERYGVATKFETASARAEVAREEASLEQLQHQEGVLMNALASLLGEPPRELNTLLGATPALPAMPVDIPVGVPSELAWRRPDILQAEANLRASTADIGAAKADFYPRVQLSGALGFAAFNASQLGSWNARQYSYGPTLYLPIFEGGRLKQTLALSEAHQRMAGIAYRQTVLQAWHEVANALDAYQSEKRQHEQLSIAAEQEQQALHVAQRNYQEGSADYLQVLTAQNALNAAQAALSNNATLSELSVVALYKAIGGGWTGQALPDAARSPTAVTMAAQ
jgi:NodT family efflux transporter outer membrane factor (OMF) lipoprotein